jgi:type IV secretory pathway TrbL component
MDRTLARHAACLARGMSLIYILVVIIVVGLLLWAAEQLPMDGTVRRILQVVVVVALVLWILQAFGLLHGVIHL